MVKIFISIFIPPKITDDMLNKYTFSYGIRYSGTRTSTEDKPFNEIHNPASIIPLSEFRQESNRLYTMNESHSIPMGLDKNKPIKITIIDPIIGNVNNEKNFTYKGRRGKTNPGIYTNLKNGMATIPIRKVFNPTDANELYLHADMVLNDSKETPEVRLINNKKHLDVVRHNLSGLNSNYLGIGIILLAIMIIVVLIVVYRNRLR